MRRPRNKIAALSLELRLEVMQMLDDGETYEAIRQELTTRGVKPDAIPGDSAFLAYRQGEEYTKHKNDLMAWRQEAEYDKKCAESFDLGGGGDGQLKLANYEAAKLIRQLFKKGELELKDIPKFANALKNLQAVSLAEIELKHKLETEAKAAELKTSLASKSADPAATQAEIDRILGVAK